MPTIQSPSGFPNLIAAATDIALSTTGDILLDDTGDILMVYGSQALMQEILVRLKTTQGDNWIIPDCGASLDLLIGQPNGPIIETMAQQLITRALTYDGLFTEDQVTVDVWPETQQQIIIVVTCNLQGMYGMPSGEEDISVTLQFDLQQGLLV